MNEKQSETEAAIFVSLLVAALAGMAATCFAYAGGVSHPVFIGVGVGMVIIAFFLCVTLFKVTKDWK